MDTISASKLPQRSVTRTGDRLPQHQGAGTGGRSPQHQGARTGGRLPPSRSSPLNRPRSNVSQQLTTRPQVNRQFVKRPTEIVKTDRLTTPDGADEYLYDIKNVARIAGFGDDIINSLEIRQVKGPLVLVHYKADADLANIDIAAVRGMVIDVLNDAIVVSGTNSPQQITSDKLIVNNGNIQIIDPRTDVPVHIEKSLPFEKFDIHYHSDGTIVRIFKNGGAVYFSTHTNLDAAGSHSRWGGYATSFYTSFVEIMKKINGPMPEDLFSDDINYSPFVYIFMITAPDVVMNSMMPCSKTGYITFLGTVTLWGFIDDKHGASSIDYESSPYKWTNDASDRRPYVGSWKDEDTFPVKVEKLIGGTVWDENVVDYPSGYINGSQGPDPATDTFLVLPRSLTIEEANKILLYGVVSDSEIVESLDYRLTPSDSIIIVPKGADNWWSIHVKSTPYVYRERLHASEPNRYMNYVINTSPATFDLTSRGGMNMFLELVPPVKRISSVKFGPDTIANPSNFIADKLYTESELKGLSYNEKLEIVHTAYILTVNPIWQYYAYLSQLRLDQDKEDLVRWLMAESSNEAFKLNGGGTTSRIGKILADAKNDVNKLEEQHGLKVMEMRKRRERLVPFNTQNILKEVIKVRVNNEATRSLFGIIRTAKAAGDDFSYKGERITDLAYGEDTFLRKPIIEPHATQDTS